MMRSDIVNHWRQHWKKIVGILACIVVFCTTYALILPAITLEKQTICGMEEHSHSEACYDENQELVCGLTEHEHGFSCYETDIDESTDSENDQSEVTGTENPQDGENVTDGEHVSENDVSENDVSENDMTDADAGITAYADDNSSFVLACGKNTITFHIVDIDGKEIPGDYQNIAAQDATRYIFGSKDESTSASDKVVDEIAPEITGYVYSEATIVSSGYTRRVYSVGTSGYYNSIGRGVDVWRFYATEPLSSGQFYTINNADYDVTLTYISADQEAGLYYDINTPSLSSKGTGWKTTPSMSQKFQSYTDITNLFGKPEGYYEDTTGASGMSGLYRFDVGYVNEVQSSPACTGDGRMKDTWYGEERFDGWTYTTDDKITYLFEPSAAVTRNGDGTISVPATKKITQDEQNNEVMETIPETQVVLPAGSMLTGHWTEVSNVVSFYVNYTGTILDVEGDVQGRREDTFTKSVAIGHVFYGKLKVGDDQVFGAGANEQITGAFTYEFSDHFDRDNPETQIVIEYMRECTKEAEAPGDKNYETVMQIDAHGATSSMVADNTLKLLKDTKRAVQVATANGENPAIDNSLCDGDHYQIRWYVMKEQTDTWHIDGVLVAKTTEIAVTKTFSGLEDEQVEDVLGIDDLTKKDLPLTANKYDIAVKLGVNDNSTGSKAADYIKMYPSSQGQDAGGAYTYTGTESTVNVRHSYHWTLHAIMDETYTLEEEQYQLDGYDVSTAVVNYYIDENGNSNIAYGFQTDTTGLKNSDEEVINVVAGKTTGVSFNNYYTKKDTGAFALVKRDDQVPTESNSGKLRGAEFKLVKLDDEGIETTEVITKTTNDNGSIFFNNLKEGTYRLEETKAPDGYTASDDTWKVAVESTGDKMQVTIFNESDQIDSGKLVYDGSVIDNYSITNTPNEHLVTVTKTFSGLTSTQMDELIKNSTLVNVNGSMVPADRENGYYIRLQAMVAGSGVIDADKSTDVYLCLSEAHRSQDGENTFTWRIANLALTDSNDKDISYVLTEQNLMHEAYADTAVDVKVNGVDPEDQTSGMYASLERGENCYTVSKIKFRTNRGNTIAIRNRYINTFDLKLRKVDSIAKDENGNPIPLAGAEFKIYGPYSESSNPTDNYTYYDDEGNSHRVYYIRTVTSGDDGYATISGLALSKGENTFVYILNEDKAPEGYAEGEPQIVTVTVGDDAISTPGDSHYAAGVLEYSAPNTKERNAILTLNTEKIWQPYTPTGQPVVLELYQVTHAQRSEVEPLPEVPEAKLVASITLKGEKDQIPPDIINDGEAENVENIKPGVYESSEWVATWYNIPAADGKEDGVHYHYFVREKPVNGYAAQYKCTPVVYDDTAAPLPDEEATQKLKVGNGSDTEIISATLIADMAEDYMVEITNTENYELPESGGPGILPFAIGGASMAAGSLLYGYRLRRKRERRSRM